MLPQVDILIAHKDISAPVLALGKAQRTLHRVLLDGTSGWAFWREQPLGVPLESSSDRRGDFMVGLCQEVLVLVGALAHLKVFTDFVAVWGMVTLRRHLQWVQEQMAFTRTGCDWEPACKTRP